MEKPVDIGWPISYRGQENRYGAGSGKEIMTLCLASDQVKLEQKD
jgi:hypothetical protein